MVTASTAYLTVERRAEAKKREAKQRGKQQHKTEENEAQERVETCWNQKKIRELYEEDETQFTVAFLIFLNFIAEAASAQVLAEDGSDMDFVFLIFEFIFNISFTIELVWNIYGNWFFQFWDSGWNWFDFIIVIISLMAMLLPGIPGISVLRLFRAFRVFRLFKRIKSLKKIIEGVLGALPGVSQAFLVLGILMGIWSVIGVEFFREKMPQFFGNFMKAMFTMFQMMTMDSWSSGIARVLIYEHGYPMASVFFISYIFISGIVMTNVVVAILLDKYLEAIDNDKEQDRKDEEAAYFLKYGDIEEFGEVVEDPTNPDVMIYVYKDDQLEPLRGLTLSKFAELEKWLEEALKPEPRRHQGSDEDSDSDSDSENEGGKKKKTKHMGGAIFFREMQASKTVFKWDIPAVLKWLSFIGFQEFEDKFKKDAVDGRTLTQIHESDCIYFGMKLLRRKQFMQALYELLLDCEWPDNSTTNQKSDNHVCFRDAVEKINTPTVKPRNSIVQMPKNHSSHPMAGETIPSEVEEEFMTFEDRSPQTFGVTNSRIPYDSTPNQNGEIQMSPMRRSPELSDPEYIQEVE